MLYPVLEVLGVIGVVWGVEMQGENFPKCGKISKMGAQQRQFWGVLWPTKYAECKENMLLTLYPVLEVLGAKGGSLASMGLAKIIMWRKLHAPDFWDSFWAKIPGLGSVHVLDVISDAGGAGGNGWLMGR